jgi:hypothetical protein
VVQMVEHMLCEQKKKKIDLLNYIVSPLYLLVSHLKVQATMIRNNSEKNCACIEHVQTSFFLVIIP